jgi:hypothetical protein
VDAIVLAAHVECPLRLEVPVVDDGAEPEDGLGSLDAHREPVMARRSPIICRHAPSITPVAIGQPDASAWSQGRYSVLLVR